MISGLQRAQQNEVYCTHVPELMDMVALGKSLGLPSRRVTSDEEAKQVAEWAHARCADGKGPVLIEAMVSYAAPSFYARGATGQEPTAQVEPAPVEPLPLTKLPEPPSRQADLEAQTFAAKALAHHAESSSWDIAECLRTAVATNPHGKNSVQAWCACVVAGKPVLALSVSVCMCWVRSEKHKSVERSGESRVLRAGWRSCLELRGACHKGLQSARCPELRGSGRRPPCGHHDA